MAEIADNPGADPHPTGSDPAPAVTAPAGQNESTRTVIIAFVANAVVAIAKSVAAAITGSASMLAEAAHSWADTGNEIFLLIADRRSRRPRDRSHPLGYGREAYVWSMFAGFGLFTVGAVVSIANGVDALLNPEAASDFVINYIVIGIAFVLEGTSFRQALKEARTESDLAHVSVGEVINHTSVPTLRAVFVEDFGALLGLAVALLGNIAHQVTGSSLPDAIGSILIGLLLAVMAIFLIERNREFLVGQSVPPRVFNAALAELRARPEVDRVSYLHCSFVGPRQIYLIAAVDLVGNAPEASLAVRLRSLEADLEQRPTIADVVLTLSLPDAPEVEPRPLTRSRRR
ncbi:cation diffusion facilitator family transporter [Naumannella halotolerans]|uniref:Cation diffusion facilitator family transporter n=1 Tax=Naumannella halotolerans TaxID=993414 RepID=A0A4R7J803_9ACTN|nr:cation diffusion facilitator family transporter [Naumannella halotolerans]TDT33394.1 cation diffusion facilitator family transporter [Naumannella halotolerans]